MLTFEEFQATRTECGDLSEVFGDNQLDRIAGLVYCNSLYIEDTRSWSTESPNDRGRYYILLGRSEYQSDDLEEIERLLYEFAISEGYTA